MKRATDTGAYLSMCRRMIRAAGKRVAGSDPEDIAKLLELRVALDDAVFEAVHGQRSAGVTWRQIGQATGTSHVAAIQKWANK